MPLETSPVASRASKCAGRRGDVGGVTCGYWGHVPLVMAIVSEPLGRDGFRGNYFDHK
jgi:hypothetical protein